MIIGILQPGYIPWLGFFEQVCKSDIFVILDDAQYDKQGWRNRNRIKTLKGFQWLTVPVLVHFSNHLLIKEVKIDNKQNWRKKHLASIRQNYSKTPFFSEYTGFFEDAYAKEWEYLIDVDMHFIYGLCRCLGLENRKIVRSSSLNIEGGKTLRLINICKKFGANTFYEGAAGKNYIDEQEFLDHGVTVEFQDYRHPVYNQLYGEFVPYLSVVDLIFNHGPDSLSILTGEKTLEV